MIITNVLILIIVLIILGIFIRDKIQAEWVCIGEVCTEWAYEDDWITDNCRPDDGTLICEMIDNDNIYHVPLENINVSMMKSCREYTCATEVYVKKYKEELK